MEGREETLANVSSEEFEATLRIVNMPFDQKVNQALETEHHEIPDKGPVLQGLRFEVVS
jgi:hypothetical protein